MGISKKALAIVVSFFVLGACSTTPGEPSYQVEANLVDMKRAPQICRDGSNKIIQKAAGGAILGGALGNQFGSGKGRAAMTLLGMVTGVSVSISGESSRKKKLTCTRDGYIGTLHYRHPVSGKLIVEERYFNRSTRAQVVNIII